MKLIIFCISALVCAFTNAQIFANPILSGQDLPDPGAIYYNGAYYVANTANPPDIDKFAIHKSTDLESWEAVGSVFTPQTIPSWSNSSTDFWAPEFHIINGKFRVIFTARESSSGLLCIGMATADNLLGPYTDIGAPLIKNTTVGSIDATVMSLSNGQYYVVWKDDGNGNTPQIPTWIKARELINDGVNVTGETSFLIKNDLPWEGDVTEGPWVIQKGEYYYLFYSGFSYCNGTYAVGVARSQSPLGPYVKKGDPILKSNSVWVGPGHCSVVQDVKKPGSWVMIYHSWEQGEICGNYDRVLMGDYVYWGSDNWPFMATGSPSITPNPFFFNSKGSGDNNENFLFFKV